MALRVGVIGVGQIGQDHIRRLTVTLPGAEVVAVSDVDEARARAVAERVRGAEVFSSGEALIASDKVEAVLVCSWGTTHAAYVLAAIAARKPVFCEKPLAETTEECSAIVDAEAADGARLVQLGFMRRFDAQYLAMKQAVESGVIGAPLMFMSGHRNASAPGHFTARQTLTDSAVHDIDIARYLLDDEPAAITVKSPRRNSRAGALTDPLLTLLEMRGGALVTIETSLNIAYGYDIRGEIIGETGTVTLAERAPVIVKSNGALSGAIVADWMERFRDAYDSEMREWIAAASRGGAAGPSAWDGYVATAATTAGLTALASGERVEIALRERPGIYQV